MIKSLIPMSLTHNPNWVFFYAATDYLWAEYVTRNIPTVAMSDLSVNLDASREDILLRASRIGWTFADNFSANWADDERAERFLKRFIDSWIPYCRSYAGTESLAPYMSYLLGMEIRIVQLWTNAHDEWDTKPIHRLIRMDSTTLPPDYLVTSKEESPFENDTYGETLPILMSKVELTNRIPDWKTIDQDPDNGWYPTSHYDVYVDLEQVPKSDLQEKTAEDIISSLFYELADINQVLRAIVYSYAFTQVVRIASGQAIYERIQSSMWQIPELAWGGWSISSAGITLNGSDAMYTASKTNTQITYSSTAQLDLTSYILLSLLDSDMQQWQAVKDAANELTGVTDWSFNNSLKSIDYTLPDYGMVTSADEFYYDVNNCSISPNEPQCFGKLAKTPTDACRIYVSNSSDPLHRFQVTNGGLTCKTYDPYWGEFLNPQPINKGLNPGYIPGSAPSVSHISYLQIAQKIISNASSSNEAISLLAEAYLDEVAKSILNPTSSKQFVKLSDIEPQLELNKQLV